jgi:hypothetical protein
MRVPGVNSEGSCFQQLAAITRVVARHRPGAENFG